MFDFTCDTAKEYIGVLLSVYRILLSKNSVNEYENQILR